MSEEQPEKEGQPDQVEPTAVAKRWYVVHTYSGYENKVRLALQQRIREHGMQDQFEEVLVPTENVIEMKKGEKRTSTRKFFPGYILVKMAMNDKTWHLV